MNKRYVILIFLVLMFASTAYSETMTLSPSQDSNGNLWFDFYELKNSQIISADITISLKSERENYYKNFIDDLDRLFLVHYYDIEITYSNGGYDYSYDQYLYLDDSAISYHADYVEEDESFAYSIGDNVTKFQFLDLDSPVEVDNPRGEIMQSMNSVYSFLSEYEVHESYYYLFYRAPILYGIHDISNSLQNFIDLNEFNSRDAFLSQLLVDNLNYYSVDQASIFVEFVRSDAQLTSVPEPSSFALLGAGLMIVWAGLRRASLGRS